MRIAPILLLGIMASLNAYGDQVIDKAVTVRNTTLRATTEQSSAVVAELPANTEVDIFERDRIWVRAAARGTDKPETGWLRFTELRFGSSGAPSKATRESPQGGGGFAGFSRSVSGFLSSFRGGSSRTAATSTIGIRGLTMADLNTAQPNPGALAWVDAYLISKNDAELFAVAGGLRSRDVPVTGGE